MEPAPLSSTEPFRAAHASAKSWQAAAADIILQIGRLTAQHRLGFVYVTDAFADSLDDIAVFLKQTTGVPQWVGTIGMGICGAGQEYFDEPAMSVLVAPIPESAFRVFSGVKPDAAPVLSQHADWLSSVDIPLGILHGDPSNEKTPELIAEIADKTSGFLVGGLTASRRRNAQLAGKVAEGDVSGVLVSLADVPVQAGLTQGCSPIGPVRTITSAVDNVVLEIDGRPALSVLKEDIGEVLARDLRRIDGYIFVSFPVKGSDKADYLVRNLVGIDVENEAIAVGEYVAPGDSLMFCRRDHDSAVTDLKRMLGELKARTDDAPIRGGLYYSCIARGPNQFGGGSAELKIIEEVLGEFPLAGFFANGEISHNRLYGYTGVLTLFV